ncbi:hypothetical protein BKA61DRAFT_677983 [Leptodontidium sp. MPI-SDFR-AT-0119]|nr:hypothetical protein BKA61DRAFT_677983 [Leptodontidium sp. MPI-SDFR-AT-0119]
MTIPKSLEVIAGTEGLTIVVGPGKVEFRIDKNIVCQASDFFSAAFERNFQEAQNGVISMPEEKLKVFAYLVKWTFSGKLPKAEGTSCQRLLYDIYILAEKICMHDLTNKTMDRIRWNYKATFTKVGSRARIMSNAAYVFDRTVGASRLRGFVIGVAIETFGEAAANLKEGEFLMKGQELSEIWEISQKHQEFFMFSSTTSRWAAKTPRPRTIRLARPVQPVLVPYTYKRGSLLP